ncbi:MAG: TlpA disulfide reductase family protein [Phycisphaerae bacterium]
MTHRWTRFSTDRFAIDLLALALAGAVMLAFAAGCLQQEDPNTFHVEGRAPSTPPRVVPATYGYPPEPPVVDSLGLREFADRFRGRVVVLDFWASWCNRCRDEMPRMVEMQRQLKASGVQVISCNLDDAQSWSRQTVPYLQSVLGNFPCVVVPQSAKGPLRDWLGQNWDFGLPARFVIDERGELIGRLLENDSIEQVASAVERAAAGASTERVARRPEGALELRFRLIDVRTGQSQSVPADGERRGHRQASWPTRSRGRRQPHAADRAAADCRAGARPPSRWGTKSRRRRPTNCGGWATTTCLKRALPPATCGAAT